MAEQVKIFNPLLGKILIDGVIKVKTGLAIGGNKSGIDIGGMDNPVIKNHKDQPYIPGSSLKGKLRSLLAKLAGSEDVPNDVELMKVGTGEYKHIARVFGFGANESEENGTALLQVQDAFIENASSDIKYTEEKMENTIDRVKGSANPRPIERVKPDTIFKMRLCLDVYNKTEAQEHLELIDLGLQLLAEDYLGRGGTRGNGRIEFFNCKLEYLKVAAMKLEPDTSFIYSFKCSNPDASSSAPAGA